MTPPLRYRLSLPRPENHLCQVELSLEHRGGALCLEMAAWCPGSYLIRDYARFLRDLVAEDGAGRSLPVVQVSKREWEVAAGDADRVVVRYAVYGHDLSVRTNHIDGSHAFLHGPALFLFPTGDEARPCEVTVEPPAGRDWPIVTALVPAGGLYRAADVDELFDCPIHIGPVERFELEGAGRPVSLAVWGRPESTSAPYGPDHLVHDVAAILDTHASRLGPLPCDRYTFLLMLSPGAYGGLEHRSSSANLGSPFAFATARGYYELCELLSHEVFHAWNGKRLRPAVFDRFDYGAENYTRCLWVVEGLTSYYDRLAARRAGVVPLAHYLVKLAEEWGRYLGIPGRKRHSLEEASLNAWVKLYKPDESNLNTTVSYYLKGGLTMAALDLELRQRSGGEMDLDRVLVHLWRTHGAPERGYPENVQPLFEQATGLDLGSFFDRFIRGREDPDLPALLRAAGIQVVAGWESVKAEDGARPPVWIGANVVPGTRVLSAVLDGGPADRGGLSPGDEIVAVDRFQIGGEADLRQRLVGRTAGERLEIGLFRRGRLAFCEVELEQAPFTRYEVLAAAGAGPIEKKIFADWLGAPHPDGGVLATATVAGSV